MKSNQSIFSGPFSKACQAKFDVRAESTGPVEISICGYIGEDYYDDSSMSEHKFSKALESYDKSRPLHILINSQGGSVKDGLGIYNAIKRWKGETTAEITGFACSISSIIPLAANKVISPKSAEWMIHDPWSATVGNVDDHQKSINMLEVTAENLAGIYAEKTGQSKEKMRMAMKAETWLSGDDAVAWGLADSINDKVVALNVDPAIQENFRNVPARIVAMIKPPMNGDTETKHTNKSMPPENKPVVEVPTPTPPNAATVDQLNALTVQLNAVTAAREQDRVARIDRDLAAIVAERPWLSADEWRPRAVADEKVLDSLRAMPVMSAGIQPIRTGKIANLGNPAIEAYRALGPSAAGILSDGQIPRLTAKQSAARIAHRREHGAQIEAQFQRFSSPQASNTFSSTLKPDALIDGLITVANNRLAPLRAFSTLFSADPVRPMAIVQVKKVTAGATGQTNPTNLESGDSTVAPISCTMAHKTQSFNVDIPDRNWSLGLEDLAQINAQSFSNLLSDVYTAIMTVANYGAAIQVGTAATFAFDSLKPVLAAAKNYRSKNLLLDGGHRAYLAPTDKFGFEFSNNGVPAFGFDLLAEQNRWTSAATNACGFVCSPDALAVATALPVTPATGQYDMNGNFTLADIGITVGYKAWFNTATGIQWAMYEIMIGAGAGDTTQAEVLVTS